MPSKPYPRRPPRLDEVFVSSPLYFVTFNTALRRSLMNNPEVHAAFREYCQKGLELGVVEVGKYVIMPDHIHLFVRGNDDFNLASWIKGLKRAIGKVIPDGSGEKWQSSFFDHMLRSDESYEEKWEYVRVNPVRAGLVATPEEWPFAGEMSLIERI